MTLPTSDSQGITWRRSPDAFDIPIEAEGPRVQCEVTLAIKPLGMTLLLPLSIPCTRLDIGSRRWFSTLVAIPATAVFMAVIEDVG